MWKVDVRQTWENIKLEEFCAQIGVAFSSSFDGALELCDELVDPYPHYRWVITESTQIPLGVLHLAPPRVGIEPTLWEEWFVAEGQLHHHVLKNHADELATDIWRGELSDTEHPREVLGCQWHYFNDVDLRPVRYR